MLKIIRDAFHRFTDDVAKISTLIFAALCRDGNLSAFTRNRKMPLFALVYTLLCRKGRSLALELRDFMSHFHPGENISKPGYLKQRMKLNPAAIWYLVTNHNRNFYKDGVSKTFNNHLVLAVDGSKVLVPSTKENIETYGTVGRKGNKPQAAMGLSCVYDVLNHMILSADMQKANFDERLTARNQLSCIRETIGNTPFIVTMDRGYPSMPFFLWLNETSMKFVVRLKASDFKEELFFMKDNDSEVDIEFTDSRMARYNGTSDGEAMKQAGGIRLRFVRIKQNDGKEEILATNLDNKEFSTQDIEKIYRTRWEVETAFDVLKNNLQLENFTGTKPRLLEQDVLATIYVSNVAADIMLEANAELETADKNSKTPPKHKRAVNKTYAIGALKNDMIGMLLIDDVNLREAMFQNLYMDIFKHVEYIRPDRAYPRHKGISASKFPLTHKRAF